MQIGSNFVDNETPAGLKNGVNKIFLAANSGLPNVSLRLFKNGVLQAEGQNNDFSVGFNLISFFAAPVANDNLRIFYRYPSTYFYQPSQFADSEKPVVLNNNLYTFGLANTPLPVTSLELYWNGLLMNPGVDYSLAGNVITILTPQFVNIPGGDTLQAYYRYAGICAGIPFYSDNEVPVGVIDGANTSFTLAKIPSGFEIPVNAPAGLSLKLYVNGICQVLGTDFNFAVPNSTTFTFTTPPPVGSIIRAYYRYVDPNYVPLRSQSYAKADILPYIQRNLNDVGAKIWNMSQLQQFINQGEVDISNELNSIWLRFPLNIKANVPVYTLPDNVKEITRITYRGYKVDLLTQSELVQLSPIYRTSVSRPRWASIQYDGYLGLRFFPVPSESLPILSDADSIYTDVNLKSECVISAYLYPTECTQFFQLPDYLFRRTIRFFVLWKAFGMEGPGQVIDTALYYKSRYMAQMMKNKMYMVNVHSSRVTEMAPVPLQNYGKKPARPTLPPNYGIVVQ